MGSRNFYGLSRSFGREYIYELTESDPHNILRGMLSEDILNNFNNNGVPPHALYLKVNDICIVLRNLNKKDGLTNNTSKNSKYYFSCDDSGSCISAGFKV